MRNYVLRAASLLGLVAAIACEGDGSTGVREPAARPAAALTSVTTLDAPAPTTSLLRTHPLLKNVVATKVIGPNGGSFALPGTGLTVTVAKGAVSANTTFSATAYAGAAIGYDFAPHQLFNAPITITQDFKDTNVLDVIASGSTPQVAYFADKSAVDWNSGNASVSELVFTNVDVAGSKVSADVYHFSGYLMSSGRR